MKFLKINEDDDELFNVDPMLFLQFQEKLDVTEKENFLIMYGTQGKTFWLQFILTFRYNYYRDHFFTEIELLKHCCIFNIIKIIESTFISMHKQYLEDGCDPLKLFETISSYVYFIVNFTAKLKHAAKKKCPLVYSDKDIAVIKDMIGEFEHYDLSLIIKCLFASRCYARFFICIYNLLQKYKLAEEVSKNSLKNNPNKQYWQPFGTWNNENFMPSFFEKYLVSHYDKKLQNMLSLPPSALKAFQTRQIYHFCSLSENVEPSQSEINCGRLVYRRKRCNTHSNCWERIFHDKGCKNPYSCSRCLLICDTVVEKKMNLIGEDFWKNCDVSFYPSSLKGHRNAMIQTETLITCTEKYICVDSAWVNFYVSKKPKRSSPDSSSSSIPCHHPVEIKDAYDQLKREFIVKYRLRKRFDEKDEFSNEGLVKKDFTSEERVNPIFGKAIKCLDDKAMLNAGDEYAKNYAYLFFILPFLRTNISPAFLKNMSGYKRDAGVYCDALTHQEALKANVPARSRPSCNLVFSHVYEGYKKLFPKEKCVKDQDSSNKSMPENKIVCRKDAFTNTNEQNLNTIAHHTKYSQNAHVETIHSPFVPNEIIMTLDSFKIFKTDGNAADMDLPNEQMPENQGLGASKNCLEDEMEDEKVEKFFSLIKTGFNGKVTQKATAEEENRKSATVGDSVLQKRQCFYCGMIEVQKKSFKKCAQCKKENFEPMHYYCSKECQKEDWVESHKKDHFPN